MRKNSNNQQSPEFLTIMALGDVGTGKSVFGSTFPTPGYVFNFDNKVSAYKNADFTYVDIPPTPEGWLAAEKEKNVVKKEVAEGKWKTVILDSTTSLQDSALARSMQLDPKRSPTGGPLWNVHYQMRKNLTEGFIRTILSFSGKCNVVIMTHYEKVHDENGAVIAYEPLLGGQLSTIIPGLFDEIYLCQSKQKGGKPIYTIRTAPIGLFKAARSGLRGIDETKPIELPNNYNEVIKNYTNTNTNN